MILNVARLKMDNLARNRFPSCNEEEIIGKGKCLSLQSCLQKGEPACWHTQRCHAGAHQQSSSTWEKSTAYSGARTAPNLRWGGGEETNP